MRSAGKLATEEKTFSSLENRNLTRAQRKPAIFYRVGDVVRFHRKSKQGIRKGDALRVAKIGIDGKIWLKPSEQKSEAESGMFDLIRRRQE